MKFALLFFLFIALLSCNSENVKNSTDNSNSKELKNRSNQYLLSQGMWLGQLNISKQKNIPFNFEIVGDSIYIINSEERIAGNIIVENDQMVVKMPVFDSEFRFTETDNNLFGFWHNRAKGDYKLDFKAKKIVTNNVSRFTIKKQAVNSSFDGKWETTFSPGKDDSYKAIGVFNQTEQNLTGTFVTETGDYRYLQGNVSKDSMFLSCFDGSHAFLFEGKLVNGKIEGSFYSGSHWQEEWEAISNSEFRLQDPYSLTSRVEGEEIAFTFPNVEGGTTTYPSADYTGKVVIIQILGSWCPNCMDETKFLAQLYNSYHNQGLEIIGLSFEAPEKLEDKIERAKNLKNHFKAEYDFLIAGNANKKEAEKAIPALSNVISFPTTIFIDKDGSIRKIHTGFYGPGTGTYYLEYVSETKSFIQSLLNE